MKSHVILLYVHRERKRKTKHATRADARRSHVHDLAALGQYAVNTLGSETNAE